MAESKKAIGMDVWNREFQEVTVRKEDMNKLVMNFLVTEGFADAAKTFGFESGTKHIDLATVKAGRMVVKKAVQNGHVLDAIEKIHNLDPAILYKYPKALFSLEQQFFIELIRYRRIEEAMIFALGALAPMAEQNGFLEEFERTFSLLVFYDVANNPVSDLLKMSRRNETARVVNEAILISQTNEKEAKLYSLLKMLAWVDKELDKKVTYPRLQDFSTCELEASDMISGCHTFSFSSSHPNI
ncbi:protein GID8 homolog isoform X2 [Henckelia pumila]|uniref:protein GID8 homolog isoform X2 n=1 Tax=Henckelia pumila TaxID=405737 RepID=UPI003C6E75C0